MFSADKLIVEIKIEILYIKPDDFIVLQLKDNEIKKGFKFQLLKRNVV